MNSEVVIFGWLGSFFGLLCLIAAMGANRRRRLLADLPTSKTTGVFIGLVELKGSAESETPFTSYLAATPCVWYQWSVEERWSRTVTETYRDSKGQTQTRTRHESGWRTVDSGGMAAPFYLKDDTGVILVRPSGANIEAATVFDQECGLGDPLYYGKGPAYGIADSDHRRRFVETAIPLHHPVYVLGQSRLREDIIAPEIAEDDGAPLYLISVREETQIQNGYAWGIYLWWIGGLILSGGAWIIVSQQYGQRWMADGMALVMSPPVVAPVGYGLATALGWAWMVYNSLVESRQRVKQGWSQVDVLLRRRYDLFPSLVETVKGLKTHEAEVQTEISRLRSEIQAMPPGRQAGDYHGYAKQLMAVAEHYPELKANESFLALQKEIVETENRIALARGYYNDVAAFFNARIEVVPECFVAQLTNMKREPLMAATDFERAPVEVHFQ